MPQLPEVTYQNYRDVAGELERIYNVANGGYRRFATFKEIVRLRGRAINEGLAVG